LKILYVGFLPYGSTTAERRDDIMSLGHDVYSYDMWACAAGANRVSMSLMGRYQWGGRIDASNRGLLELARGLDFDLLWVDKGTWLYPEILAQVRALSKRKFAVHYTPDSQILSNRTRHYLGAIAEYDVHVTTKPFEVEPLKQLGARHVILSLQGYGVKFGHATPAMARPEFASDICFIGHCQPHYRRVARSVAALDHDFKIWGQHWPRWARRTPALRPCVKGDAIWGDAYPAALVSSKIALGLLSKYIPETTTTRTFEIPATGTFMLAERTDDHCALFDEGKEAEFFGSTDELREKAAYYLNNDSARIRIAVAGRERSLRSGYAVKTQFARIFETIKP
jgi:spore maturation protein CgeB